MKSLKRFAFGLLILTLVGVLFRGWLYRNLITYKSIGPRTNYKATNGKLIEFIESDTYKKTNPDINQIIEIALDKTSEHLN